MKPLEGKVAFVTGAGSGIGQATAVLLAGAGARVACLSRDESELDETIAQITRGGGEGMAVVGDVSKSRDLFDACRLITDRWRRLDIDFSNAGVNGVWARIEDLAEEEWEETLAINLSGTFYTIKHAVPYLKRQGGAVVVTASVNGTRMFSSCGATAYATSKAGQTALAKMLALELAPFKVRVNVICPGAITTAIHEKTEHRPIDAESPTAEFPRGAIPLTGGAPGKADQVARLVLFLVSDDADHITGTEVWIDGAQSLLQG
jgi:NAD(P)-dependent dehydrogenase (short-subunit alcohol dehydrogenase family)